MKFCTKCGAELVDEAVICVKCGRMVEMQKEPEAAPSKVSTLPALGQKASSLLNVSNFVHTLSVALSLFFTFLSVGLFYVNGYLTTNSKNYITGVSVYGYPLYELLIPATIFSGISFIFSVLSFVMALLEKHGRERLFAGISRIVISMLCLACSIVLMNA